MNKILYTIVTAFLLISCNQIDLNKKVESRRIKQGLIKTKKVGWLTMKALLKSQKFMTQRLTSNKSGHSENRLNIHNGKSDMVYFDLRLSINDKPGDHIENYNVHSKFERDQRIQYLSFSMQNDLYLLQGDHIIPCELFHFERNYSLSGHRTFMLGFPNKLLKQDQDLTLVFDSQYLSTGPLKIRFTAKDINDSTQIEL